MGIFRQSNTPLDLGTSRRLIGETFEAIQRLEPRGEVEARIKKSMLTAARMIEAHHAAAAWIESMISRLWGHLDGLQSTFQTLRQQSAGEDDSAAVVERQGEDG